MVGLCKNCCIAYVFKDTLEFTKNDWKEFDAANPSKKTPVLWVGNTMIISSSNICAIHLSKSIKAIKSKLY